MASLNALSGALVALLETLPELTHRVSDTAPEKITTPWAWITIAPEEESGQHDAVFSNIGWWYFDVALAVGRAAGDGRALHTLYDYMSSTGPKSVKLALDSDPTLGGQAMALLVDAPFTGTVRADQVDYVAARWRVRVLA